MQLNFLITDLFKLYWGSEFVLVRDIRLMVVSCLLSFISAFLNWASSLFVNGCTYSTVHSKHFIQLVLLTLNIQLLSSIMSHHKCFLTFILQWMHQGELWLSILTKDIGRLEQPEIEPPTCWWSTLPSVLQPPHFNKMI